MATSAKKIVLKPAPLQSKSGQFQGQIIVLPSSFIQQVDPGSSNSIRISNGSTLKISKPAAASTATSIVVPAQAAGSKRPMVYDSGSANAGQPARKRANLDHMSPEEKLMRRKLKNRVAAQNARDKKRLRDEIEVKLQELEEANAKLQMENESLRALNERLMSSQRSTTTPTDYPNTTFSSSSMTPPHSDYYSDSASSCGSSSSGCDRAASPTGSVLSSSSSSSADCSLVDSRSFDSAEIINASQQKSQDRGWAGLWTAMALMTAVVPAAFCQAAAASCQLPPAAPKLSPSSSPPAATSQSPPDSPTTTTAPTCLPIKKRHLLPP